MNNTRKQIENLVDFSKYDTIDDFSAAVDEMENIKNTLDNLLSHLDECHGLQDAYDSLYCDIRDLYRLACKHVNNWNAYEREFRAADMECVEYDRAYYRGSIGL